MIIAVVNQKGGVGKTATATNLAHVLTQNATKPALIVDADPQANATTSTGITLTPNSRTLNDVLVAIAQGHAGPGAASAAIHPATPAWGTIDVIPAERLLASRNTDTDYGREHRLATALNGVTDYYAHTLIDCPPSPGVLTLNALTTTDIALIITEPRRDSVDGVAEIINTITLVRNHSNPTLKTAILINKYRDDWRDCTIWRRALHNVYGTLHHGGLIIDHPLIAAEIIPAATTNQIPVPKDDRGRYYIAALQAVATDLHKLHDTTA